VQFHQGSHEQQADARAPSRAPPGIALPCEGVEHERQYFRRDPDSGVPDSQNHLEISEQALDLPCRVFEPSPDPLGIWQQLLGVPSELDAGKNAAEGVL
jgi:hypothetical protein